MSTKTLAIIGVVLTIAAGVSFKVRQDQAWQATCTSAREAIIKGEEMHMKMYMWDEPEANKAEIQDSLRKLRASVRECKARGF